MLPLDLGIAQRSIRKGGRRRCCGLSASVDMEPGRAKKPSEVLAGKTGGCGVRLRRGGTARRGVKTTTKVHCPILKACATFGVRRPLEHKYSIGKKTHGQKTLLHFSDEGGGVFSVIVLVVC